MVVLIILRNTATRCNTLQHTATHYNTLPCSSLSLHQWHALCSACHLAQHCNTLQHTTTHRTTPHHTDVLFSLLLSAASASPCSTSCATQVLVRENIKLQRAATHCSTLQHTAAHCSTLQHTTTHCNTLRHTATAQHRYWLAKILDLRVRVREDRRHGVYRVAKTHRIPYLYRSVSAKVTYI